MEVPASFWNGLSWHAAVRGVEGAKQFAFATDLSLGDRSSQHGLPDMRGLVRAHLGDRDGAIKDFEANPGTAGSPGFVG